jgi:hypothetical protein
MASHHKRKHYHEPFTFDNMEKHLGWPVPAPTPHSLHSTHTTSCEDGLAGLSKLMTPDLMYSFNGRFKGEYPAGMGV